MNLSPSLAHRPSCSEVAFLEDLESHTVTPVNPNMYFLEERVKVHCKKKKSPQNGTSKSGIESEEECTKRERNVVNESRNTRSRVKKSVA